MLDGRKVIRYTQAALATEEELREAEVLIIDCFGLLSSVYHYGTVAYVGGGFGVGIHNVLEAPYGICLCCLALTMSTSVRRKN